LQAYAGRFDAQVRAVDAQRFAVLQKLAQQRGFEQTSAGAQLRGQPAPMAPSTFGPDGAPLGSVPGPGGSTIGAAMPTPAATAATAAAASTTPFGMQPPKQQPFGNAAAQPTGGNPSPFGGAAPAPAANPFASAAGAAPLGSTTAPVAPGGGFSAFLAKQAEKGPASGPAAAAAPSGPAHSEAELAAFRADVFEDGKIPELAPPPQMCK
jgi:nucleoporin NUP42